MGRVQHARWPLAVQALLVCVVAADSPALASTVSVADGVLTIQAGPGEVNVVQVGDQLDGVLTVSDTAMATAGPGCVAQPTGEVACPSRQVSLVRSALGDGNDRVLYRANFSAELDTGAGDDAVTVQRPLSTAATVIGIQSAAPIAVLLGGGNDTAQGWLTPEKLDGGPGDDKLEPDGGANVIQGGSGVDTVSYEHWGTPVVVDLDGRPGDGPPQIGGGAGQDTVGADIENIVGGRADDRLTGNAEANRITGGDGADQVFGDGGSDELAGETGNDTLIGGRGHDLLSGGEGDDSLLADDGEVDSAACGAGADTAHVDDIDALGADCEVSRRHPTAQAAAPAAKAKRSKTRPKPPKRRASRKASRKRATARKAPRRRGGKTQRKTTRTRA